MFKKTHIIICLIFMVGNTYIFSQKSLKKAEMQIETGDYALAIDSYKIYLKDHPLDYNVLAKLADACAANGDFDDAIMWYESIDQNIAVDPITYKNHGDILRRLGRIDDAIVLYNKYRNFNPIEADHFLNSCEYSKNAFAQSPTYETFVMPSNSNASDFGLTFYKDMPVFSSFRNDILMSETEKEMNTNNNAHKSFLYNQSKNRLGFIKAMDGGLNFIGPISFSKNGLSCAIIQSKIKDSHGFITSNKVSSLHIATVNDRGEITSTKPFMYNEVGSSINAAHMAFDGTAIYFSSDRKGGYGGFDIYVSYIQNGEWSLPKNLGSQINTLGNEITPFLKGSELYFSSDYHTGLGGFDIVKSEVVNGIWTTPKNLGVGANSISDDYFPCYNSFGELYLTSNRLGGKGNNDIYKTLKVKEEVKVEEFSFIPKAVSLDELAEETQKHTKNSESTTLVSIKEINTNALPVENEDVKVEKAFKLPQFDVKKVGTNAFEEMSLEGAHRTGVDGIIPTTEVYFIQLASVSSVRPNFERFKVLIRYGNIYKMNSNKSIKVRLGYFIDRKEAEEVLAKVRSQGFQDVFITYEILNTAQMELMLSSTDGNSFADEGNLNSKAPNEEIRNFKVGSKYKVRLASYEDPIWFDINKVKDIGRVEQWTKGGWTIFILAGYNDLEDAKQALVKALNRGFKTAEVVIDNGGILERLKQN